MDKESEFYVMQSRNLRKGIQKVVMYKADPDTGSPYIPVVDGVSKTRSEYIARGLLARGFEQISGPTQIAPKLVEAREGADTSDPDIPKAPPAQAKPKKAKKSKKKGK